MIRLTPNQVGPACDGFALQAMRGTAGPHIDQIMEMHLEGCTARKIAKTVGLHHTSVVRKINKTKRMVAKVLAEKGIDSPWAA